MDALVERLPPRAEMLDPERVIEADTPVGTLWLERDAEILTPTVLAGEPWEPRLSALLPHLLREGMTVVDAGANIGYLSVCASKLVGPSGRVYCVEVDPANIPILRANLWRNGCTNAEVLPVAAWCETGRLNLSVVPEGGACSHVAESSADGEGESVPAFRLDELIRGRVDFLKVDCEGTDHLVVQGAEGLFRANPRLLATVEFVPGRDSHTGHTAGEILGAYRGLGLRPYVLGERGHLRATRYERLEQSGAEDRLVVYDFALSRRRPARLLAGGYVAEAPGRAYERLLKLGGDLLEHVPARIRPRIRRRDRQS